MATIPMGNFGQVVASPTPAIQRSPGEFGAGSAKAQGDLAQTVGGINNHLMAQQTRLDQEQMDLQDSSAAMDAALKFEAAASEKSRNLADLIHSGQIEPEAALDVWNDEVSRLRDDSVGRLPASRFSAGAARHAEEVGMRARSVIAIASDKALQGRSAVQAAASLDSLGKVAVLPGEDLESIFAKADQVYPTLAQRAGFSPAQASSNLQNWKDSTRFQRARVDLVGSRRSIESLDTFTQRLESGDLVGKLDPEKRTTLVKEAESYKWQLQQAQQHEADRREKIAERAVAAITRQIEAAVPVSAEGWQELRSKVGGTSSASDFNALVQQERTVQQVLRLPSDQQEAYVQQREAKLMQEGGTMVDRSNLQRIKATIETNRKELEQAPLLAAQRLYGRAIAPIDFADLVQPGGAHRAAMAFADRATTLEAMSKQFGTRVGQRPLLPQEKAALVSAIDMATPSEATNLYGALRAAIDDDGTYKAVMQQISPDSPVKAQAGLIAASARHVTLQDNWITEDVRMPAAKIAQTMLAGEAILNRSKKAKAEDGQARTLFAPPREAFAATFADQVGDLYRGRPGSQEADLQAAYAYYTGKAAELGKISTDGTVDTVLAKESMTATLGSIVNLNGQGHVKAPLGMSASKFETRAREQFGLEVRRRGLPASMLNEWPHYGLQSYRRDGTYVLTMGNLPVVDPNTRAPVVIDLDPLPPSGIRYRSTHDLIPTSDGNDVSNGGTKR